MPKIKMTTTTKEKKKHIPFGSDVNDQQNLASINTKINWLSTNILYTQKEKTNHKSNQENYRNKKLILVNYQRRKTKRGTLTVKSKRVLLAMRKESWEELQRPIPALFFFSPTSPHKKGRLWALFIHRVLLTLACAAAVVDDDYIIN